MPARVPKAAPKPTSAKKPAAKPAVRGPFAALVKKGEFKGFVKTASGQELYVSIKLGKKPATSAPVVMLDGIAARHERNTPFERELKKQGLSVISVFLPGQGETLAKDMKKGGTSLSVDIEQEAQAKAVIEVLDALGVKAPVHVAGLSYGGGIAAQLEKTYPTRFSKVMLLAPFVDGYGDGAATNPFLKGFFQGAVKAELVKLFPDVPKVLEPHPGAFHNGLFRLTMGMEDFELKDTVKGMEDVHFMVVPEDGASPPEANAEAYLGAKTGSFSSAPESEAGNHDLVRANEKFVAKWISDVVNGRVKATEPPK